MSGPGMGTGAASIIEEDGECASVTHWEEVPAPQEPELFFV